MAAGNPENGYQPPLFPLSDIPPDEAPGAESVLVALRVILGCAPPGNEDVQMAEKHLEVLARSPDFSGRELRVIEFLSRSELI